MAIQRQSNVDFEKWNELRRAIRTLIDNGTYEGLVSIHSTMQQDPDGFRYSRHRMHGMMSGPLGYRRFLPWHRAYLILFERGIRSIDRSLSLPYWDWNEDAGRLIGFRNIMGLAASRNLGTRATEASVPGRTPWFTTEEEFSTLVSHGGDYYAFARHVEDRPHNGGHAWIGGDMNSMASPRDPAFWFHHAQVDRIWSLWQLNNPGERAHLLDGEADLDPWEHEFSVQSVDDISDLGTDSYEYVPPRMQLAA